MKHAQEPLLHEDCEAEEAKDLTQSDSNTPRLVVPAAFVLLERYSYYYAKESGTFMVRPKGNQSCFMVYRSSDIGINVY